MARMFPEKARLIILRDMTRDQRAHALLLVAQEFGKRVRDGRIVLPKEYQRRWRANKKERDKARKELILDTIIG